MNIRKAFSVETICPKLNGKNKEEIITELLTQLSWSGKLNKNDIPAACDAIMQRERKMSTGIQDGVAIPHAKFSGVDELVAVMGLTDSDGVDFESLDGQPSHIIILTLSPENKPVPHVQFLAELSECLLDADTRQTLISAETANDILTIFQNYNK